MYSTKFNSSNTPADAIVIDSSDEEPEENEELWKITVQTTGGGRAYDVRMRPTQRMFRIKQMLRIKSGLSVQMQRLVFNGHILEDRRSLLSFEQLRSGSTIFLQCKKVFLPIVIYYKNLRGSDEITNMLEVQYNESVESVKIKLQEREWIPPCKQMLIFNGRIMQNNKTLDEIGCKNKSMIYLTTRVIFASCSICEPKRLPRSEMKSE